MDYAVVHFPNIDTRPIDPFRKKYDPQAGWIEPHVTVMFPVPELVGEDALVDHLRDVLSDRRPFPVRLRGLRKSWDDYLFLTVEEGGRELVDLHGRIYTGPLAEYRKDGAPFVPHLTLGAFAKNAEGYAEALEEATRLDLDYRCVVDEVHLLKVDDDRTRVVRRRAFSLSA
jgi:2'-5' RNA ligase